MTTAASRSPPTTQAALPLTHRITQVSLYVVALIAIMGGTLQMYLGEPQVSARLDNVHRFMAGVYLSTGIISFWAARTYMIPELVLPFVIALTHRAALRR